MLAAPQAAGQAGYVVRFAMEKERYVAGEPVFCRFTIENTGATTLRFAYRFPTRVVHADLEGEPDFSVKDETGRGVPDPMPRPCGGAQGSVVYGSVTLPPGQVHTERWLLNQWARLTRPGNYSVRAERRLPLLAAGEPEGEEPPKPLAFALALNELRFELAAGKDEEVRELLAPYVRRTNEGNGPGVAEALMVLATLPRPFMLEPLARLAAAPADERRWDRQMALEGLARLGTPQAWKVIEQFARGRKPASAPAEASAPDLALRRAAIQLMAQRGDPACFSTLLEIAGSAPDDLRGDAIRALGQFKDPRAGQALFEYLRSPRAPDRVSAVLGLRNLGVRDVVPALLAMFNDPDPQVRQVTHFALLSLTGQKIELSADAGKEELARVAARWKAWWQDNAGFTPLVPPPCRDW